MSKRIEGDPVAVGLPPPQDTPPPTCFRNSTDFTLT